MDCAYMRGRCRPVEGVRKERQGVAVTGIFPKISAQQIPGLPDGPRGHSPRPGKPPRSGVRRPPGRNPVSTSGVPGAARCGPHRSIARRPDSPATGWRIGDRLVLLLFALFRHPSPAWRECPVGRVFTPTPAGCCGRIPSADPFRLSATCGSFYHCIPSCRPIPCSGLSPSSVRWAARSMLKTESTATRLPRR